MIPADIPLEFVRVVGVMAAVLGAIVPIVIGAAVARSALGLIIYGDAIVGADSSLDNQGDWVLLGLGVALALLGVVVQSRLRLQRLPSWSQTSSIAAVRLVLALEEEFGTAIPDEDVEDLRTVEALVSWVSTYAPA